MHKPLKIFVDGHCLETEFQGAQTFVQNLYTNLLQDYPDIDVYFGACDCEKLAQLFPSISSSKFLSYKKRSSSLLRFVIDIPSILKRHRFDFAHFQYLSPPKNNNCKYIVTLHDILYHDFPQYFSLPYRVKRNFIFQRSIKEAAIKTTVSAYSRDRIHYHFNIPKDQVHILPNGVSNDFSNPGTKEEARALISKKYGISNFILYVSRVEPRKNHDFLLNEFLAMKLYRQNISLVFIGKRSINVVQLDKTIKRLTSSQKKYFFQFEQVNPIDLEAFYKACRLFVYPSMAEGFGIPPLEAAACNAPVLCSNATAMHDFNFFAPYIFDPENKKEFHEKIRAMIDSPPTEDHLKKIAAEVRARYAWQKSSDQFYALLQSNSTP